MSSKNRTLHWLQAFFSRYSVPCVNFFIAFFLITATMLAALAPANALREDFLALSQQKSVAVCGCSIRTNTLTIKNTGDVTSVYSVAQSGSAASWSTLSETGFSLKPGETKDLVQFIRAPCRAEGTATIETTITTLFHTSKKISQEITVPKCNNIVTVPLRPSAIACPAQPMQFQVALANPLSYSEVYELRVEPGDIALANADKKMVENSVSISEHSLLLAPRQKKNVLVFFHAPSTVYGSATLNLVIRTRNSGLETVIPLKATINQCYDFSLTLPSTVSFCTEFENRLPLELANNALVPNTYQIDAGILTYEGQVQEAFDLGAQELPAKTRQNLFADMLVETEPGDYFFGVEAQTLIGDLAKYAEVPLEVTYCDDTGKPLTLEEYEALQQALEPVEEPEEPEVSEAPPAEEEEVPEELSVSPAFIAVPVILVLVVLLLGIIAARKVKKRKLLPTTVTPYESFITKKKRTAPKAIVLGLLAVLFIILLVVSLLMVASLFPAPSGDEEALEEVEEPEAPAEEGEETEEPEEMPEEPSAEGEKPEEPPAWLSLVFIFIFVIVGIIVALLAQRIYARRAKATVVYDLPSDKKKLELDDITLQTRIHDVKERAEKALKKPKKLFLWLGLILLLVLVGIGAVLLGLGVVPAHQNLVVSIDESFHDPAQGIFVDGASVRIPAGTEVDIPLVFKNPDDGTPRRANLDFNLDWLKPSRSTLALNSGEEREAELTVSADATSGRYTIVIAITNEKGELFAADEIMLTIGKTSTLLYAGSALIVVILIILLALFVRRLRKKRPLVEIIGEEESTTQKRLREAVARAAAEEAARSAAEKAEKQAARKKKLKKIGTYAGALLIILVLTWGIFALSRTYMVQLEPPRAEPVEITTEEPAAYELLVTGLVSVPIKIINKNRTVAYSITAQSNEQWISFDQSSILVEAGSAEVINMLLAPNRTVADGTYKLAVKIEEHSDLAERTLFTSSILVKLSGRGFLSTLKLYWLYLVFGVLILLALLFLLGFEARRRHREMLKQLVVEAKKKVSAPKQKKSKYRLPPTRLSLK